jgi:hypothetical protein
LRPPDDTYPMLRRVALLCTLLALWTGRSAAEIKRERIVNVVGEQVPLCSFDFEVSGL